MAKNKSRLLKPNPNMVGTKTVEVFINKKEGVKKEKVIRDLMKFVNMRKEDAEDSVGRAVGLEEIIEKDGKLFLKLN